MNINIFVCIAIIVIVHLGFSDDVHSKSEYDRKSTNANMGHRMNSLVYYLINTLHLRDDRLLQYDLYQANSDFHSDMNELLMKQSSRHSSEIGSFDIPGYIPFHQSSTADDNSEVDMPSFSGNDNVFDSDTSDMTGIDILLSYRNRYEEYRISPTCPSYPSLVAFVVLAYVVSYTPNTCDLADANTIPIITRIQKIKEVPSFKDLSNDDLNDLLNALYVSYEASIPRSYTLKPFETTPDCSGLVPPQTDLMQIFVLSLELISFAQLAESAKTFCVKSKEFDQAFESYRAHSEQPEFRLQIDQSIKQVAKLNNPTHSSSTPLTDVARLLMSNLHTSQILTVSPQARIFALCHVRRAFNFTDINSNDYQQFVDIINQNNINPTILTHPATTLFTTPSPISSTTTSSSTASFSTTTSSSTTSPSTTTSSSTAFPSTTTSSSTASPSTTTSSSNIPNSTDTSSSNIHNSTDISSFTTSNSTNIPGSTTSNSTNISSSTTPTSISTSERQKRNNTDSSYNSTTTIMTTSETALSSTPTNNKSKVITDHASKQTKFIIDRVNTTTTPTAKSHDSTSSYSAQQSPAQSGKLSSLQIGLICTGVIVCIIVLVFVAIFFNKRRSRKSGSGGVD